jgi:esterase/lipase superfamily enzyme
MGRHVIRQTPEPMPSAKRVAKFTRDLDQPFIVVGSRGLTEGENQQPDFQVHGDYRFATGDLQSFADKHAVFFIPGYNNTNNETLESASDFFGKLHDSLGRDGSNPSDYTYALFTWPGDTGTVYFDDAQVYAQHSGSALFKLFTDSRSHSPRSVSIVSHSLGAHVALRSLSILGERLVRQKANFRINSVLLLGAAVEDDVFSRPERREEYHFPESAFGMENLYISVARSDNVLGGPFRVNENDIALGFAGPEDMGTLKSLARRVSEVLDPLLGAAQQFMFEAIDFSPNSAMIINPDLHVINHGGYWRTSKQTDFYVNLIKH